MIQAIAFRLNEIMNSISFICSQKKSIRDDRSNSPFKNKIATARKNFETYYNIHHHKSLALASHLCPSRGHVDVFVYTKPTYPYGFIFMNIHSPQQIKLIAFAERTGSKSLLVSSVFLLFFFSKSISNEVKEMC